MNFTLIICTYKRRKAIESLFATIPCQTLYPSEIIIVDGSPDDDTQLFFENNHFENLTYYKVAPQDRGLTKQRNYGLRNVSKESEVVCFLDDDTVLNNQYFYKIIHTYKTSEDIVGVGGVAINENRWQPMIATKKYHRWKYYSLENYVHREASRNVVRNILGLSSNLGPGKMPNYSHGRTCGFPLTGKIYEVDLLIGMSMSFRRIVFENSSFSTYFEGYGLYEDADYSIRALHYGKNVINTAAQLEHHHDAAGRPNKYSYGKMVVRNGWYVWRVKNPNPKLIDRLKWNAITLLLTIIRATNIINTQKKKEALTEVLGRFSGWLSLIWNTPKTKK